jgi:hypothetical protein
MRNSKQPRRQWTGFTSTVKLFLPVWGADFEEMDGLDVTQVKLRIANLAHYIKSRQLK